MPHFNVERKLTQTMHCEDWTISPSFSETCPAAGCSVWTRGTRILSHVDRKENVLRRCWQPPEVIESYRADSVLLEQSYKKIMFFFVFVKILFLLPDITVRTAEERSMRSTVKIVQDHFTNIVGVRVAEIILVAMSGEHSVQMRHQTRAQLGHWNNHPVTIH